MDGAGRRPIPGCWCWVGTGDPSILAIDVRRDDTPVYTLPNVSDHGGADAVVQAAFVDVIEPGLFTYRYDD